MTERFELHCTYIEKYTIFLVSNLPLNAAVVGDTKTAYGSENTHIILSFYLVKYIALLSVHSLRRTFDYIYINISFFQIHIYIYIRHT